MQIDPIITLPIPDKSFVSSLCFLYQTKVNKIETKNNVETDSTNILPSSLVSRCGKLLNSRRDQDIVGSFGNTASATTTLPVGCRLVSSHMNGETYIWNVDERKVLGKFINANRGQGMMMRLVDQTKENYSPHLIYQTRDNYGTVSLHDYNGNQISEIRTKSKTFCTASPCIGNPNLVAVPDEIYSTAVVRDWRVNPMDRPVAVVHMENTRPNHTELQSKNSDGMVTSLGLAQMQSSLILSCGMESGNLHFHDLTMPNQKPLVDFKDAVELFPSSSCNVNLGTDPILCQDVGMSTKAESFESIFAVAGMPGELNQMIQNQSKKGTIAIVKAIKTIGEEGFESKSKLENKLKARVRATYSTCNISDSDESLKIDKKPGISICRLHPDGRVFATGGWDYRVRIFDRTKSAANENEAGPLRVILRGHTSSISAMDWLQGTSTKILATAAASDTKILIWKIL